MSLTRAARHIAETCHYAADDTVVARWERGGCRVPEVVLVELARLYRARWLLALHPVAAAWITWPDGPDAPQGASLLPEAAGE